MLSKNLGRVVVSQKRAALAPFARSFKNISLPVLGSPGGAVKRKYHIAERTDRVGYDDFLIALPKKGHLASFNKEVALFIRYLKAVTDQEGRDKDFRAFSERAKSGLVVETDVYITAEELLALMWKNGYGAQERNAVQSTFPPGYKFHHPELSVLFDLSEEDTYEYCMQTRMKASDLSVVPPMPPIPSTLVQGLEYSKVVNTFGAPGSPQVNARCQPIFEYSQDWTLMEPSEVTGASASHWEEEWSDQDLQSATDNHVMLTWTTSAPAKMLPRIVRAEGVYLYDSNGKQYLDWTSQAVCSNFGHNVPEEVTLAIQKQMASCPYVYGGLGIVPIRARLSKLLSETLPGDITGFLFPSGGSEANEAAIRIARRFTGKPKILTQYRSYHGGTGVTLGATGDFRRNFSENGVTGFVKMFNPQPMGFSWGNTDEGATKLCLEVLEEQILNEGPASIAAIMLESVVGAGGVLVPPQGYMQGVRALCDKYGILLILDEVMTGFGRTGRFWAFQHFDQVVPDIITSAKGLTGSFLPLAMVGVHERIRQWFMENPIGWGSTYQAHPVALACAYECVKYMITQQLPQRAAALQQVMTEEIQTLATRHPTVKQGRAIGLFGCIDLIRPGGQALQRLGESPAPEVTAFKEALYEEGIMTLFRPPLLHCCPPLTISEEELRNGFRRVDKALNVLDKIGTMASSS